MGGLHLGEVGGMGCVGVGVGVGHSRQPKGYFRKKPRVD